ncbi:MAG: hypothetical protein R2932_12935 [Caldilineaceae bacterium]
MCRGEAKISVFDSGYLVGDGVWEGIRLHDGVFVFLDEHLDRLFAGAKDTHGHWHGRARSLPQHCTELLPPTICTMGSTPADDHVASRKLHHKIHASPFHRRPL